MIYIQLEIIRNFFEKMKYFRRLVRLYSERMMPASRFQVVKRIFGMRKCIIQAKGLAMQGRSEYNKTIRKWKRRNSK